MRSGGGGAARELERAAPPATGSDGLEVTRELPLGDDTVVLAALPVARPGVVIDERLAEEGARRLALLEGPVRLAERPRERREVGARRGVALDERGRGGALLDPPETGAEDGGHR